MSAPARNLDETIEPLESSDGTALCRVVVDGQERLYVDRCPHRGHPISQGAIANGVIRCSVHGWEFCADTGRLISPAGPFALERKDGAG